MGKLPKTMDKSTPNEANDRRKHIRNARTIINHGFLALGKELEIGHLKSDWEALGYESEIGWLTDPHGIDMKPRTARLHRLVFRAWEKQLLHLGITGEELATVDHVKLGYVAKQIMQETNPEKILEIFHQAKTLTLRELQEHKEEQEYYIVDLKGKIHKALSEKSGWVLTISQGKPRIPMSVQNFWEIFGNKQVEIKIRLKKEE